MEEETPWRAYLALGVGVLCIAFSGIFVYWAFAPGTVTGFYRMAIATAVLLIPFWRQAAPITHLPRREVALALLAGLFFAGDLALWNTGILISGATTPTLLANTAPVWVGLGALLLFRERLTHRFWLGLLLALGGAAVILGVDTVNDVGLGALLGLIAGIFYGGYFLAIQRTRRQLASLTSYWLAAFSSVILLLVLSLMLRQPLLGYPTETYLSFLGMGLISQGLGHWCINYALGYLPASIVSPTLLGQPVLTGLLAMPLLGERFTIWQAFGATAVLVGVYLVHTQRT